jgi:hypothetical protein
VTTLFDTGPLVASIDRSDKHHARCAALLESRDGPLLIPPTVIVEVCWLLEERPDIEAAFLESVVAGEFRQSGLGKRGARPGASIRPRGERGRKSPERTFRTGAPMPPSSRTGTSGAACAAWCTRGGPRRLPTHRSGVRLVRRPLHHE